MTISRYKLGKPYLNHMKESRLKFAVGLGMLYETYDNFFSTMTETLTNEQ